MEKQKPFRVGFFIDGFTFHKVNNYYKHYHSSQSRICIGGLRNFVINQIRPYCPMNRPLILEGHYYHARTNPLNKFRDFEGLKRFEGKLLEAGIQMHYPNVVQDWKRFGNSDLINDIKMFVLFQEIDIVVLLTTQGFYAETARLLKNKKIPLFLLGWNFSYPGPKNTVFWKTDVQLKERAFQYFPMEKIMEKGLYDKGIRSLFVNTRTTQNNFNYSV